MRNLVKLLVVLPIIMGSCTKGFVESDFDKYKNENIAEIEAYLASNNLTDYSEDVNTGIFWKVTQENIDGEQPSLDKRVHVAWSLSTLDGTELYSVPAEDSLFFDFNFSVFQGFTISLNTLREGEKGTFYIPSVYAFGDNPPSDFTELEAWDPVRVDIEVIQMYNQVEILDWFIAKNNLPEPFITESGVRIIRTEDTRPETDDVQAGEYVNIEYKGYFVTEGQEVFDEGLFSHVVASGGVIEGFDDALEEVRYGEKVTILLTQNLAYGETGSGSIPPFTPIAFDIVVTGRAE
ncbi:FKBP-type peptidyl-prolyl cis-trans isomerase [Jiulongibacter sp. NS-SX5]|uniref:FKBP-type peptidyl-prolyl cis-trans isomerase n=1 Tax=Jiulongibacter sp. NS-SX5 TaxID=3463854 RepID=UPI004058BBDF